MSRIIELISDNACFYGHSFAEAVEDIRKSAYFEKGVPLETYIDHLVSLINTRPGYDIKITGETAEEKAKSLINELCRAGIFKSV